MNTFISSAQKEFAIESNTRAGYLPNNPLLAEPLYLTKSIESMGTGTRDMIRKCVAAGLPEPEFSLTDSFVTTIRRVSPIEGSGRVQLSPPVTRKPKSRPESPAKVDGTTGSSTTLPKPHGKSPSVR